MKIIIVGLGSMGKRRLRLLMSINKDFDICGVDSRDDRCEDVSKNYKIVVYKDLDFALNDFNPDVVIVSTSPLSHADIIEKCLNYGCHVFTELNLVSNKYSSNVKLAKEKNKILFLSSTCLYKNETSFINEKVVESKCRFNYMYHIGQYLPDWHPWEKINDFFVTNKATNGCRELFAIELPWLIKTFGKIKSFEVIKDNISSLNLNFNDNYLIILNHESGHKGVIALDVVSRKACRKFELYGENLYLTWDGTPNGLFLYDYVNNSNNKVILYDSVDKQDGYADFIVENAYLNELCTFFDIIDGKQIAKYTFEDDLYVLDLIDSIEGND